MTDPVLIGLAVTSHNPNQSTRADFSRVSTTGNVTGNWQIAEIGVAQPAANDPAPVYAALEDTAGNVAVVVHPDSAATLAPDWVTWDIPLDSFFGVNLARVGTLYVGVGDRDADMRAVRNWQRPRSASTSAGSGVIYWDDIELKGPHFFKSVFLSGAVRDMLSGGKIDNPGNPPKVTVTTGYCMAWNGDYEIEVFEDYDNDIAVEAALFHTDHPNVWISESGDTGRDFVLWPNSSSTPLNCAVYRFRLPPNSNDLWYFTADESRRNDLLYDDPVPTDNLIEKRDPNGWAYDGVAFCTCSSAGVPGVSPVSVHHFWSEGKKNHFYTVDPDDKSKRNNPSAWTDGGVAFYAFPPYAGQEETTPRGRYPEGQEPAGTKPVYHLLDQGADRHFYTISESERTWAENQGWECQAVAWYAFDPHDVDTADTP
jgi:hypothetical protein